MRIYRVIFQINNHNHRGPLNNSIVRALELILGTRVENMRTLSGLDTAAAAAAAVAACCCGCHQLDGCLGGYPLSLSHSSALRVVVPPPPCYPLAVSMGY